MKFDSFEWDESKRCSNIEKHNVDFEEILDLFDTFLYEIPDNRRGYGEKRTIAFGELEKQVYCLVYTLRGKSCRLITARRANERERKAYYSFLKGR
ncbi:BrnT family toxin [Microcystis aeruginosa]|jgi:uncharacterized DUF497 family protein|uniref:BrnT family toxin n=1 Tax=Microcystis aeruginosa TaxID=1126 RepID=UPI0007762729|nr:BrnT family toxin [Microcystis aeruginosa]BCU12100.1 hypothetical protein MAN88_26640 [Microcystis aeruginosa]